MILRAKLNNNKRTYRDIYIDPFINLHTLADSILDAYDFNFDHCYGFFKSPDVFGKGKDMPHHELFYDIKLEVEENCESVVRTIVSDIFHEDKEKWWMLFDYGDDWIFEIECVDVEDEGRMKSGTIIKTSGKAPSQY